MSLPKREPAGNRPFRATVLHNEGTTRDAAGQPIADWRTLTYMWVGNEVNSGREFFEAKQTRAEISSMLTAKFNANVKSHMRIVPKRNSNRTLEIVAVIDKGGFGVEMDLLCKEAV